MRNEEYEYEWAWEWGMVHVIPTSDLPLHSFLPLKIPHSAFRIPHSKTPFPKRVLVNTIWIREIHTTFDGRDR